MKFRGTLVISLVALFERVSFIGVRAILVLCAVDPAALNLVRDVSLGYYKSFSMLGIILLIPTSLVTDVFVGQRKSIFIGAIFTIAGCTLLCFRSFTLFSAGAIFMLLGTSLVKPSAMIMVGRQFNKMDRKRTLAYFIYFLFVNVGSFAGIMTIGYFGEHHSWNIAFIAAGGSTLIYLVLFSFFHSKIDVVERNTSNPHKSSWNASKSLATLSILLLVNVVYWNFSKFGFDQMETLLVDKLNLYIFNDDLLTSLTPQVIVIFFIILTSVAVFLKFYIKGIGNTFNLIIISMAILGLSIFLGNLLHLGEIDDFLIFICLVLLLYGLAQALIFPLLMSYVTRLSDVRYSNTIYSSFVVSNLLFGQLFIFRDEISFRVTIMLISIFLMVLLLFIFRKKIMSLSPNIN